MDSGLGKPGDESDEVHVTKPWVTGSDPSTLWEQHGTMRSTADGGAVLLSLSLSVPVSLRSLSVSISVSQISLLDLSLSLTLSLSDLSQ